MEVDPSEALNHNITNVPESSEITSENNNGFGIMNLQNIKTNL